jgi:phospholipid-transporting ATPase
MLLSKNLIPITLITTIEIVKFIQGKQLDADEQMVSYTNGKKVYCHVNSSNLNEELGSVNHIFTDKTGTLTCNEMTFKFLCVNGISWGESNYKLSEEELSLRPNVSNVDFKDANFYQSLNSSPENQFLTYFLQFLLYSQKGKHFC